MDAWVVDQPGPIGQRPLRRTTKPEPEPGPHEVRIVVEACGVCRTDLHLAEGDLPPRRPEVVPGHEVVGTIDALGPGASRYHIGDRLGIAWLRRTCGACRFCRNGQENLCTSPQFTGWDADGGYAALAVVHEDYAYPIPGHLPAASAAPLLCSGIVGYRALRRCDLPARGRLGIYGFGGSAHLVAQVAIAKGATVHVLTRSAAKREQALELGAASAGHAEGAPPEPLDAAIIFAPAGELVPPALRALDRGGKLVLAGIHMSRVPSLDYDDLFLEREVRSVTANTREDGRAFLELATSIDLDVRVTAYPFDAADTALDDLAHDRYEGAAVICRNEAGQPRSGADRAGGGPPA